jgi:hypothetical protein
LTARTSNPPLSPMSSLIVPGRVSDRVQAVGVLDRLAPVGIDVGHATWAQLADPQQAHVAPGSNRQTHHLYISHCTRTRRTCPNPTSRGLMPLCRWLGSHDSRLTRVCSGVTVGGLCHLRRLVMRWTCTSTPIPALLPVSFPPLPGLPGLSIDLHVPRALQG